MQNQNCFFYLVHKRFKFLDLEQFGNTRDEFELFKFNSRVKFQTNDDRYFNEEKKINYAFSRLKIFAQNEF